MKIKVLFHPKFAAGVDLILGLIFVWWITNVGNWWSFLLWLFFRLGLWALLIWISFYPARVKRLRHLAALSLFLVGMSTYLLFLEWSWGWMAAAAVFALFPAIGFWLLPSTETDFDFSFKPYRRWNLSLSLLGLAGLWSAIAAVPIYQLFDTIPSWIWGIVGALIAGFTAGGWWLEYGIKRDRNFYLWTGVFTALIWEIGWVFAYLPLGPFVLGLMVAWLWYVLWLLARFHLSDSGLNWTKQKWFLIFNGVLFFATIFLLARWK